VAHSFPSGIISEIHPLDDSFNQQLGSRFDHLILPVISSYEIEKFIFG
jgi:hypothetical protein